MNSDTGTWSLNIPQTISAEAQQFLRGMKNPALGPNFPHADDAAGWAKVRAMAEQDGKAKSAPLLARFAHVVTEQTIGGTRVLDIRPTGWTDNGTAAVYTHGGAHVMYSAESSLGRAVVFAHTTGLRVFSIDYTVAPIAKYNQMSDEVVGVVRELVRGGQSLKKLVVYGDSSGGGLAAASILKMRDKGVGLPAAAVLVSPWLDVTPSGDTEATLHDADPNQLYEKHGVFAAEAFAPPAEQRHPYASPVYGDFSKGFPPTLIQGGLKETLLSGFVRMYQALDAAGVPVKLDLYEGMIHNFQDRIFDCPESALARKKMRDFVASFLGTGARTP